ETLNDRPHPGKMIGVNTVCAAERQTDAVQRKRIAAPDRVEMAQRRAAAHVVLDMHLEPGDGGPCLEHGLMMLETQPDPGRRRHRTWMKNDAGRSRGFSGHSGNRVAPRARRDCSCRQACLALQAAFMLPPWIFAQSPAGSSTYDFESRACVACPAQECAPSAQSFLATALIP